MADFDLAVELDANAAGLVQGAAQGEKALDGVAAAGARIPASLKPAETATAGVAAAVANLTGVEAKLDAVIAAVQQNTIGAARGHSALRDAIVGQASASTAAATVATQLGAAQGGAANDANALAIAERNLAAASSEAERASAAAALAALKLQQAQEAGGATASRLERDLAALRAELDPVGEAERKLAQNVDLANTALARGVITQAQYDKRLKDLHTTTTTVTAGMDRQAYAVRNAGQQFGDFGLQVAGGTSIARAFGQQAGQLGFALSEMNGRLGKVGAFLTGPWGIALTVAAAVLAPMVEKLFEGGKAAEEFLDKASKAASAADSFGSAQSLLGKVIDLTTGKLKTQNKELIESIRLQALAGIAKAKADQTEARRDLLEAGNPNIGRRVLNGISAAPVGVTGSILGTINGITGGTGSGVDPRLNAIATQFNNGTINITQARQKVEALGLSADKAGAALLKFIRVGTNINDITGNQQVIDAIDGKGVASNLRPNRNSGGGAGGARSRGQSNTAATAQTAALGEFGRDAADKLAGLRDSLDNTPNVVRQVNQQVRQLDDLIDDLGRKKPPNFQALIADARALRPLIVDGLNKPFNDFVQSQQDQLAILRLTAQGRTAEAEAMRVVVQLERQVRPLTPERKDAILATVEALQAEQRQIDINRAHTELYLGALGQIKGVGEDATQAFVRGDLGQFIKSPGKLLQAFQQLQGRQLFEKLFGDTFRQLQDQVSGTKTVEDASARMADAVDQVTSQTDRTTAALDALASASKAAAGAVGAPLPTSGLGSGPVAAGGAVVAGGASLAALLAGYRGPTGPGANGGDDGLSGESVVTGKRQAVNPLTRDPRSLFAGSIENVSRALGIGASSKERNAQLLQLAEKVGLKGKTDAETLAAAKKAGVTLPDDVATKIGKFAGKGIEGAASGAFANSIFAPLAKGLGLKTSATGAKIGGALGGLTGLPFAGEIGGILGSVVGGLFKKTKTGSATISNVDGAASVTGTSGNSGAYRAAASSSASAVGSSLDSIVDQLGGDLGNFSVSIGQRKKKFVVDSTGQGRTKGSGTQSFGTEEEAQAAALRDAILDGAVAGISAAMQAALRQNSDVNKAVAEALKVKEVEAFIGSVGDKLKSEFDALADTAADRVRIAKKYGLDVVAVEKANAAERAKLVEDTLVARVGSLKDLLSDLASGDLFEGSASDKRKALLSEIATTKAKADAGEDGAADTLATLYRNLLATSKDAFGTAGTELTSDRATVASGAAAVIKAEQDRVNAAAGTQQATTMAVQKVADLTDETNNILAVQTNLLRQIAGGGVTTAALSAATLTRVSAL